MAPQDVTHVDTMFKRVRLAQNIAHYPITIHWQKKANTHIRNRKWNKMSVPHTMLVHTHLYGMCTWYVHGMCTSTYNNVSFPFELHSAAVSVSHLPCRTHAMLRPCRSSQGHGTARPSRDGLWATMLPCGVPRRLLSEAYQSQMQVASVKRNEVCHGRGKEW
jgi:hypothetical protein